MWNVLRGVGGLTKIAGVVNEDVDVATAAGRHVCSHGGAGRLVGHVNRLVDVDLAECVELIGGLQADHPNLHVDVEGGRCLRKANEKWIFIIII